jgi:hypothetical protein
LDGDVGADGLEYVAGDVGGEPDNYMRVTPVMDALVTGWSGRTL